MFATQTNAGASSPSSFVQAKYFWLVRMVSTITSRGTSRKSGSKRQTSGTGLRYFKVKVQIDNPDDRLRPGMTSQVSIITSTAENSPAIPIQSVVERVPPSKSAKKGSDADEDENLPKKKYVFVIKDGKAKMTEVTTGISDATHVSIAAGLKVGDQVVTGPFRTLKKLSDGDAVQVTKEETKPKEGE